MTSELPDLTNVDQDVSDHRLLGNCHVSALVGMRHVQNVALGNYLYLFHPAEMY